MQKNTLAYYYSIYYNQYQLCLKFRVKPLPRLFKLPFTSVHNRAGGLTLCVINHLHIYTLNKATYNICIIFVCNAFGTYTWPYCCFLLRRKAV